MRHTPMGVHRKCGEPNEIELTPTWVELNSSRMLGAYVYVAQHELEVIIIHYNTYVRVAQHELEVIGNYTQVVH